MKTWLHIPTGKRYGEWCYGASINIEKGEPTHLFIMGKGRVKIKTKEKKDWKFEEIPDLRERGTGKYIERTNRQDCKDFREYAAKYGVEIASKFLSCADICKYTWAHHIMNPRFTDEQEDWFQNTFGCPLDSLLDSLSFVLNRQTLDVLKFQEFLAKKHGYTGLNFHNKEESMSTFCDLKWGKGTSDKIKELF